MFEHFSAVLFGFCIVKDQYSFIHDALLEFIQSGGETEIKSANVSQYLKELHSVDQASSETLLEKQYKVRDNHHHLFRKCPLLSYS